ncbi:MAG: transposase, partial [Planctomycetaceae bacterium]|nr:transposase [Planctomycetaceae bacterium]
MARLLLTDEEWDLIADVFPEPADTGRPRRDPRRVLDGILWVLRTGSPWRD